MGENVTTLASIFPAWDDISKKYSQFYSNIKLTIADPAKRKEKKESLFWEEFAFELIITMLIKKNISFKTSIQDVQPTVKDVNGIEKEIDFRIRINDKDIYFGVTHFYGRPKDINKDKRHIGINIRNIIRGDALQSKEGKIISIRPQTEYLNRRMVVRVASEGKREFNNDYTYIVFPKVDQGFGGGLDCISKEFSFISESNYNYRKNGITGIMLIGQYAEVTEESSTIQEDKLLLRTMVLNNCSKIMGDILMDFDMNIVDLGLRNRHVRSILQSEME